LKFYIATDHAGFAVKDYVKSIVESLGHEIIDLGPNDSSRVGYPDFCQEVCRCSY